MDMMRVELKDGMLYLDDGSKINADVVQIDWHSERRGLWMNTLEGPWEGRAPEPVEDVWQVQLTLQCRPGKRPYKRTELLRHIENAIEEFERREGEE